ncbi:MAG: dehydrogenase [Pseudomonadota bacterium]|jgi:2,4-dienoyl-CoA reductase-like NADH-dependent reductase (Old Yellow Enzyme family)
MSRLFSEHVFRTPRGECRLSNRTVVAPMCQYAAESGRASDWHLQHWAQMLNSGTGLFIIEATAVEPAGRISTGCLGLWDDDTASAMANALHRARRWAPPVPVCIQLAHAGRKASSAVPWAGGQLLSPDEGGWPTVAPSALPHLPQERPPKALSEADLDDLVMRFVQAAQRAQDMGIEAVELHAAHGYLLHEFLSPLANRRNDAFGGSFDNRVRFPLRVFEAVRAAFGGVLGMRVSASDWVDGGWTPEETADLAVRLKAAGADYIHVSSGGVSPQQRIALGSEYQVPFARMVKHKSGLTTMAVGLITEPHQAEAILSRDDADLIALARAYLYQPRWSWQAAAALGGTVSASPQYWRCLPAEAKTVFGSVSVGAR